MAASVTGMAGRVAIAILLVLLAAGSAFAAAATLSGPTAVQLAEETAEPSEAPEAEPSEAPEVEGSEAPEVEASESPDAARAPKAEDADEDDAAPSLANLERIVGKLGAAGITTTTDELAALAEKVGVGGAVRVLLFADASGSNPAEILALVDSGKGWGVIAKELELDINPGLGRVMGNGHGPDKVAKDAAKAERAAERAAAKAARTAERAARKAGAGD